MKGRTRPSPCGSKKILRHPENPPWGTAQPGEVRPLLSGREPFRASQCGAPPDCGQGSEAESDSTNDVRVLLLVRGGRTDNRRRFPPGVADAQHRDLPGLHRRLQPAIPKHDKHHDHGPGSVSHGQGSGHSRQCHFHLLAPYSPELNPIERYWKHLKDQIAWRAFEDLQQLKDHVARLICETTPERVRSLTQFPFFMVAING